MHIVFCIAPFSGHVNPSLAVVSELARRGHRVSYATTAEFAVPVREAGGRAMVFGTTMQPPQNGGVTLQPPSAEGPALTHAAAYDLARGHSGQLRELKAVLPVLISAFSDDAPDVVVCDPMSWAGRALAARLGVPPVSSVTTMIGKVSWSLGPVRASFNPADPRLPQLFAATSAVLARSGTGLTADRLLSTDAGIPSIVYHPRAFEAQGDQFGPDVHFVGPCLSSRPGRPRSRAGSDLAWRPPAGGPVVLVSLGTVFNRQPAFFRCCIDALAELRCHVIVALGGLDAADLGHLPANAQAHSHLRLAEVMRHVDVLVGHGGMTSTMEALSFGVPIAALPQIPEQHVNAARLADLGLGLCLEPARQTQETLRQAVTTLLGDPGIRRRLDWMRTEIGRAPGAPTAAAVIENAARSRRDGRNGSPISSIGTINPNS